MVETDCDTASGEVRYILSANRSLTRRQVALFLAVAGATMMVMGLAFSFLGLWLVLPFSGLEWLVLYFAFRWNFASARLREVLTIGENEVLLEQGRDQPEYVHRFQRVWLAMEWVEPEYRGHPARLTLGSHGKRIDLGSFLPDAERLTLYRELSRILR